MIGSMMQQPLLISSILEHAAHQYPDQQIVSRKVEGGIHRITYSALAERTAQLAHALRTLGVKPGDRVATLAWNTWRHVELYYAISGLGAICHTVNPRLFQEQIRYIVNHAEDVVLCFDLTFASAVAELAPSLPTVKHFVALCDPGRMNEVDVPGAINYEALLQNHPTQIDWPVFDERDHAALCYTSGTTGNPKGVLYSHRSTVIHALASCTPNALALSEDTVVMPVVPMYHVAAWGIPYSGLMAGSRIVLPGLGMDGASLHALIDSEDVGLMLGVPTVWLGLLDYLDSTGQQLPPGKVVGVGGARTPLAIAQRFWERHQAYVMPLWGMTETSPLATFGRPIKRLMQKPLEERLALQTKAGRPCYGIEIEIFDEDNQPLPHDGEAVGSLRVRGPWVVERYFGMTEDALVHGWFETGDMATIDPEGYLLIVDRRKDVIKSGGEWISSIELENAALGHPAVAEACVIGVAHPKWDERPLLLLVLRPGATLDKPGILAQLEKKVAKWWLPDDILAIEALPHTATGKLDKKPLREQYRTHFSPPG